MSDSLLIFRTIDMYVNMSTIGIKVISINTLTLRIFKKYTFLIIIEVPFIISNRLKLGGCFV